MHWAKIVDEVREMYKIQNAFLLILKGANGLFYPIFVCSVYFTVISAVK